MPRKLTSNVLGLSSQYDQYLGGSYYGKIIHTIGLANLVGYWPGFDPFGSTIAADISGNNFHAAATNVVFGVPGIGDQRTAMRFDGATSFANPYSAGLAAAFPKDQGTLIAHLRVANVGVWVDGLYRVAVAFWRNDASRYVVIRKDNTGFTFWARLTPAGSTSKSLDLSGELDTWFNVALTWNLPTDQVIFYYNGAQQGAIQNAIGAFGAGDITADTTRFGSYNSTPLQVWNGDEAHIILARRALTPAEVLTCSSP